jgi:hypothetical protein
MTRALLVLALCGACGGGTDHCATPAATTGATLTAGGNAFVFGQFEAAASHDCTVSEVESMTVDGSQVSPAPSGGTFHMTFCLPRPDQVGEAAVALSDDSLVQVINLSAQDGLCTLALDRSQPLGGTLAIDRFCSEAGLGFNLTLAGTTPGIRRCGDTQESVTFQLSGQVAVIQR